MINSVGSSVTGSVFNYTAGRIDVRFRHEGPRFDDLRMVIRARGAKVSVTSVDDSFQPVGHVDHLHRVQRISCPITTTWCPFPQLLAWLEAVASGVQYCATEWDAEGPDVRLEWSSTRFKVNFCDRPRKLPNAPLVEYALQTLAERRQVVGAIYAAFRGFVQSSEYDPLRYEGNLSAGELAVLRLGSRLSEAELVGFMVTLDRATAEMMLQWLLQNGRGQSDERTPLRVPDLGRASASLQTVLSCTEIAQAFENLARLGAVSYLYIPTLWDRFRLERRRRHLRELFISWRSGWGGTRLRDLRSPRIEAWLRERRAATP